MYNNDNNNNNNNKLYVPRLQTDIFMLDLSQVSIY